MCGIFVSLGEPLEQHRVDASLASLSHRGPDGRRTWKRPVGDGEILLGHARLAIMDPEGGDQPLANETEDVVAVVNGELYGFERIRGELEARGHLFRTKSDSEIVVHLYEEFGDDFVHRLRGEFAVVLWDARRSRLIAVRDRFGIKPLFFAIHGERVLLASEAKALFAAGVPARWNATAALDTLVFGAGPSVSMFAGVFPVLPGGRLVIEGARRAPRIERYWCPSYPAVPKHDFDADPEGEVERARELIKESIEMRLRADVPIGFHLSSGYDSNAVAAFSRLAQPRGKLKAFTVAFDHGEFDESADTRAAAEELGLDLEVVSCSGDDIAREFRAAAAQAEFLGMNGHVVAKYRMSRAIRDAGLKVVLSGDGADELFMGYGFCRADYAAASSSERAVVPPMLEAVRHRLGVVPTVMTDFWASRHRFLDLVTPGLRESTESADANTFTRFLDAHDGDRLRERHPLFRGMDAWIGAQLQGYILAAERLDMAHSVEVRLPLLDHELFEYAASVAPASLMKRTKFPLREAAWPVLPSRIKSMTMKKPFQAPPSSLHKGAFARMIEEVLTDPSLARIDWLNAPAIREFALAAPDGSDTTAAFHFDLVALGLVSVVSIHEAYGM